MEYKILPTELFKKGFHYQQIWRENEFAIYEQTKPNIKGSHFEPIKITKHNGFKIGGIDIPPAEIYPGDSQSGILAFTCFTLEEAHKKIDYMKNHVQEIAQKNKEGDLNAPAPIASNVLKIPNVEFCLKDLIPLNPNMKPTNFYPKIQKLLKDNKLKETKRVQGIKGKATVYYCALDSDTMS